MKIENAPSSAELEQELKRERYKNKYKRTLKSTIYVLLSSAAIAVLVATLWLPVLQIYGSSMTPTLHEGEIVISLKENKFERGDVIAFYFGNRVLIKRYVAGPGEWVDIEDDGTVLVNGEKLDEPYVNQKSFGNCDLELPYQVPEGRYFMLGDDRATSVDSRHSSVGCVAEEQIVGKIIYKIWPLDSFGSIK
ncbi:MAG: signal peptidase I [Acutalibacteraceae bacterium]|nr:signal peptidase I [Acutalibacteraceae bacterium]